MKYEKEDSSQHRRSAARRLLWPAIALAACVAVGSIAHSRVPEARQAGAAPTTSAPAAGKILSGMATGTGTVTASKPFKVAQVFLRNPAKRITYMVFATQSTSGNYRVVDLFPGDYEVAARAAVEGLETDMQATSVKAGEALKIDLALHEEKEDSWIRTNYGGVDTEIKYGTYDEIFPKEPGLDVLQRTCQRCHGANHEPLNPGSMDWWVGRIDRNMMGLDMLNGKRPSVNYQEGTLNYRNTALRFSRDDHQALKNYLAKYMGANAPKRAVKTATPEYDQAALARAQFIEYTAPADPQGKATKALEYIQIGYRGRRVIQDPRFDAQGNVWGTDRAYPTRIVKLDPRTGEMKDYPMPEPTAEIHDFIIARDGIIWLPQHGGAIPYGPQRLWGFNPKTEKFEHAIDMDPSNFIRMDIKWMQSLAETSKGDIVASWFMGGALSMWHKAENKVTVHPMPYSNADIYGTVAGKDDTIYSAEYTGKITGFHSWTATDNGIGEWVEYTPPRYPGQIRRPNVDYQGRVIYGEWSGGPEVPAVIGRFEPSTGRHTQWPIPEQVAQPYDQEPDPDTHRIWFADSPTPDRAAQIGVLDTLNGRFTFYPKPQFDADSPKLQVTRDGAIWYAPRGSSRNAGLGALYPDKDKITTLGAFYVNGPPGYPFRPVPSSTSAQPAKAPAAKPSAQ